MTSTTKCPDCSAEAPYSGKGPHVVRCGECRRAHLNAKQSQRRRAVPRKPTTVRERPPCVGCGAALPPHAGRGAASTRCWPCTRAYRTAKENEKRRSAVPVAVCVGCGASMPGRNRNALRCAPCALAHKADAYRARHGAEPRPASSNFINGDGYRVVSAPEGGQILEHRLVMARLVGRPLRRDENVHHINGQRADNRPENLELWSRSQPAGQRVEDKTAWALEWLAIYAPERLSPC